MSDDDRIRGRLSFLKRWLLAAWLPPLALGLLIVALPNLAPVRPARSLIEGLASILPYLLWLLLAAGQAWAVARHYPHYRQWAVVAFLAGFLAMLCLLFGSGMFPQHRGAFFRVLAFLSIWFLGLAGPSTFTMVSAGAIFGLIIGTAQATLLRWRGRHRLAWILFSATAGVASFGWLAPLHWRLHLEIMDNFGATLPRFSTTPLLLVGPTMCLFMLGWLVFALLTGAGLTFAFELQRRRDRSRIATAFD